jgi:hypothetical protein
MLRATSRYWSRYGHSRFVEPFEVARDTESDGALETEQDTNIGELQGADQLASS